MDCFVGCFWERDALSGPLYFLIKARIQSGKRIGLRAKPTAIPRMAANSRAIWSGHGNFRRVRRYEDFFRGKLAWPEVKWAALSVSKRLVFMPLNRSLASIWSDARRRHFGQLQRNSTAAIHHQHEVAGKVALHVLRLHKSHGNTVRRQLPNDLRHIGMQPRLAVGHDGIQP